MKNPLYKLLFALLLAVPFSGAQAQIFPALNVFDAGTGVLKLPGLLFDGKLYYLEMSLADAAALTLKIEAETLVDITPDGSTAGKTPEDIVGTWDVDGEDTRILFNSDGTFTLTANPDAESESCPDGGVESGTFRYTASTGVFFPAFVSDENGECGLSHTKGLLRIFSDGNTLTLNFSGEENATLIRVE